MSQVLYWHLILLMYLALMKQWNFWAFQKTWTQISFIIYTIYSFATLLSDIGNIIYLFTAPCGILPVVRFMLLLNVVNVFFVKWIFNGTSLFLNNLKLKQHYLLIFYFLFWKREHVQHELMNLHQVHNKIYFTCGVSQLYKSEVRFVICDSL